MTSPSSVGGLSGASPPSSGFKYAASALPPLSMAFARFIAKASGSKLVAGLAVLVVTSFMVSTLQSHFRFVTALGSACKLSVKCCTATNGLGSVTLEPDGCNLLFKLSPFQATMGSKVAVGISAGKRQGSRTSGIDA